MPAAVFQVGPFNRDMLSSVDADLRKAVTSISFSGLQAYGPRYAAKLSIVLIASSGGVLTLTAAQMTTVQNALNASVAKYGNS